MSRIVRTKKQIQSRPSWWTYAIAVTLTLMLTLTVNYSAFSELNKESTENEKLGQQIENVTTDNLALQEQIHYLKNDPQTVEREVKKFGLRRPNHKVSVPANK